MNTLSKSNSQTFGRTLTATAMAGSMLLVLAAGSMPEGLERGDLIVYGHGVLLAAIAGALVLRAAYALGFRQALESLQPRRRLEQLAA